LTGLPVAVGAGIVYYLLIERPCMNPNWPPLFWQRLTGIFRRPAKLGG